MKISFFDNNVTRMFFNNDKGGKVKYFSFIESLKKHNLHESYLSSKTLISNFSRMEAIGFKIPNQEQIIQPNYEILRKISNAISNIDDTQLRGLWNQYKLDLFEKYRTFYQNHEACSPKKLIQHEKEQFYYTSRKLQEEYKVRFMGKFSDENIYNDFLTQLALDHVYSHQLNLQSVSKIDRPHIKRSLHKSYLSDLIGNYDSKFNISLLRALTYIWTEFKFDIEKNFKPVDVNFTKANLDINIRKASSCLSLKKRADFLDQEIIHYASIGCFKENTINPVTCFTADPQHKIETRLSFYKAIIESIELQVNRELRTGKVIILNKVTGEIEKIIDIKKDVKNLFAIIATPDFC